MADTELWRSARKQISEYEQQSSELGVVLQSEKDALLTLQKEIDSLNKERAELSKKAEDVEARAQHAREQRQELLVQADKAMAQSKLLIKQRELLQDSKRELLAKLQEDRLRYEEHTSQLHAAVEQYRTHLAAAQAAIAMEA